MIQGLGGTLFESI
jgi:hypothetical protein